MTTGMQSLGLLVLLLVRGARRPFMAKRAKELFGFDEISGVVFNPDQMFLAKHIHTYRVGPYRRKLAELGELWSEQSLESAKDFDSQYALIGRVDSLVTELRLAHSEIEAMRSVMAYWGVAKEDLGDTLPKVEIPEEFAFQVAVVREKAKSRFDQLTTLTRIYPSKTVSQSHGD